MAAATGFLVPSARLTPAARGARRRRCWHRRRLAPRCAADVDGRQATVESKAGDALEVCRVVNGMWQVSGASWGRAQPAAAVDAMLRYADGGLATFDMADICKEIVVRPRVTRSRLGCLGATFARLSHPGFRICF
ncbi:hypothetical protein SEVIR_2G138050v4 [Setaria viridis]